MLGGINSFFTFINDYAFVLFLPVLIYLLVKAWGKSGKEAKELIPAVSMISLWAAYAVHNASQLAKSHYKGTLITLGFSGSQAERLLKYEMEIVKKHGKKNLDMPFQEFVHEPVFDLEQPYFMEYPKTQEDIKISLSASCAR